MASLLTKCKLCRRAGEKLFLRGGRCNTPKCAMVKRAYPPGIHGQVTRRRRVSEYGKQLHEKQKAKRIYGVSETQFNNYFKKALKSEEETDKIFLKFLELRLDNVIYRAGFAKSRRQARQMVSHGLFLVNGQKVDVPSYQVKQGQSIKAKKQEKKIFADLAGFEKEGAPGWLSVDFKELAIQVLGEPKNEELPQNINAKLLVEFYSK